MAAITTCSDFEAPQISRGAIKNIQQLGVGVLLLCQVWRKGWGGPGGGAGWPGQAGGTELERKTTHQPLTEDVAIRGMPMKINL